MMLYLAVGDLASAAVAELDRRIIGHVGFGTLFFARVGHEERDDAGYVR